jgi:hypothetical protein
MSKENFFPSVKGDKGLVLKKNKKNQLTILFVGDKGPLTVTLDKETSNSFVEHILDITKEHEIEPETKDPMPFVNKFIDYSKQISEMDYGQETPNLKEIDKENHPFTAGHVGDVDEPLTGED